MALMKNDIINLDKYFNINLEGWRVVSEDEFSGFSHEKITEKIYVRGNK